MTIQRCRIGRTCLANAVLAITVLIGFAGSGCTRQLDPKELGTVVNDEAELPGAGKPYPMPELGPPARKAAPSAPPQPGPLP